MRGTRKPEDLVRDKIVKMLRGKNWFCVVTHGNMFQSGLPDIYATHKVFGHRWVEVKMPNRRGDVFTAAQHDVFPKLCAFGDGVWVLTSESEEEYKKLFRPSNWWTYLQSWR